MGKEEKIYVFIDSQNLNLSVNSNVYDKKTGNIIYYGWKLDFKKFFIYLRDKHKVSKAFLFIGKKSGQEVLYRNLESYGYQVIYKPTMDYSDENGELKTKGNIDAELILHSMLEFTNYDKAIIVAGDGDYYCLINYLSSVNKLGKIIIPNRYRYSSLLKGFRHYFVFCSDFRSKLEY
jgi:uncharacterized LabA/DUF88 family protein